MAVSSEQLRSLIELGLDLQTVTAVVAIFERTSVSRETSKENDRLRSQRYRDNRRANGMTTYFRGERFRADLMRRDGGACVYCGKEPGTDFDHFLPISQGGTDHLDNLGLACRPCNSGKGGRTPDEARMTFSSSSALEAFNRYLSARNRADGARINADDVADDRANASARDLLLSSFLTEEKGNSREVRKKNTEPRARKSAMPLPDDWQPSAMHRIKSKELKLPDGCLEGKAEDMRIWAQSNGIRKVNWDATFHGFLRRAASEIGGTNGQRGSRALQDDSLSCSKAADRLIEATKRGEFTIAPRPSLLPTESPNHLRLLPKG